MPKVSANQSVASQRDQAYKAIRRLLVLQQIEPGQRLREPQWAERLKIHRSALREAFARLEAEGLIDRGQRTGYFVPRLTASDLTEITKLRLAFECLAVEEICLRADASLAAMTQASNEFARFMEGNYSLGVLEADRRFHEALIDAANMTRLSALYHRAPLPLIRGDTEDQTQWRQSCERTLKEHRQILAALKSRNATEAKRVLRLHLTHQPSLPLCH
ncbi:MAG TPA: GntR family transcriptional regulator [Tepidisphaeraceae bacterium]|jgi:DNA-binding GntR family transcriptional regulator|nr:GntR family transcriptional regulator [Tepidisphaeraceae bacterium]